MVDEKHRRRNPRDILIIGGGAGGLELAARLGRADRRRGLKTPRVTLIDRSPFHLWKPSLHEVAAGSLDSHQEGLAYTLLARRNRFRFVLGDLTGLDAEARTVRLAPVVDEDGDELLAERAIPYDRLVLALGSGVNLFGTPGADRHAHQLENVAEAEAFHRRLTLAFLAAAGSGKKRLSVAIVGGGATGVELAAELMEGHHALMDGLPPDQRFPFDVTVVEALPRLLPPLSEPLAAKARQALETLGVTVMTDAKVERVDASGLDTSQGRLEAELIVWAAGVAPVAVQGDLGLALDEKGRIVVDDRLRTSAADVWALGDCAAAPGPDGKPVPARAQAASQQAAWLARAFRDWDDGREPAEAFTYRDKGSLVSLGDDQAVGALMGGLGGPSFRIEGLLARWAYVTLHLDHHRAILGVRRTALLALSRLLHRRVAGRLKLH
ncbi:NAD(P)/FAD-dependent oxidoreductase [Brevundimonas sp.]|uniref:NAD(P)/FAD-dependent oxidoreductase n=1 Tax=Brevundimonas sp. TaxID=1871086 RepID=UPI0035AED5C8